MPDDKQAGRSNHQTSSPKTGKSSPTPKKRPRPKKTADSKVSSEQENGSKLQNKNLSITGKPKVKKSSESSSQSRRRGKKPLPQSDHNSKDPESSQPLEIDDTSDSGQQPKRKPLNDKGSNRKNRHSKKRQDFKPEQISKRAWKIYLAEVGEEGVALINDTDARELSRRCFRLAEIFMEEEARRN